MQPFPAGCVKQPRPCLPGACRCKPWRRPTGRPKKPIGRASDTGRPGPTWLRNGKLCKGDDCENHADNQYLVLAKANGTYAACTKDNVCGFVEVVR